MALVQALVSFLLTTNSALLLLKLNTFLNLSPCWDLDQSIPIIIAELPVTQDKLHMHFHFICIQIIFTGGVLLEYSQRTDQTVEGGIHIVDGQWEGIGIVDDGGHEQILVL